MCLTEIGIYRHASRPSRWSLVQIGVCSVSISEVAPIVGRKRRAEDSVKDKLTAMVATIEQLMPVRKTMAERQTVSFESNKAMLDRNKELMETLKT